MDKSADLSADEVNYLEMVFNRKFTSSASAPKEVEAMVLKGYVYKKPIVILPMMPIQYSYELSVHGLLLLREYRPQYC